ncbi:hypothetical protein BCS37_00650 [Selenomonas sp. oral taxon 920]|uniref:restriction endonuclease subunit S n=1 Tax=Selenomonas sp. oral taxon 920 TaxID=1884263 RepID=UPI000840D5F5|nr:restriction endonuclease subunit S [Selenomonas sp. oral taxon 920]AOH47046.1 hypothetical protein BCS37_00650 [Selenomonas sp. oral taxon 920]
MVTSNLAHRIEEHDEEKIVAHESPVKYSSVALSDVIARGNRLEASVFDVEAMQARMYVLNGKYGAGILGGDFGLIKSAYYPGRFKRVYCDRTNGKAFFLPSQMTDVYPKAEKYISAITKCDIKELELKPNTLLLTRSGTIGTVSLVSKTTQGKVYSDDVIRVQFKERYDLGFVYAFFKTSVGNKILTRNGYGAVITHIEPEHLATIPIPDAPAMLKNTIHHLIEQSYALRDASNDLIDEATALLVKALNLPPMDDIAPSFYEKATEVDTFSVPLSRLAGRLEASYHVPVVDAVMEYLRQNAAEVTTIGDPRISREVILPGRFKRVYVDERHGRVLIGGKQLYELDPAAKKYISGRKHEQILKKLEVHENTILLTRSGTIGKVSLVPRHWEHYIPSDHIIRIVPVGRDMAGYLYIFLASDYAQPLIRRFTYGSVVDEVDDHHVRSIAVPLLKDCAAQKKINDLALAANEKRYEAYCLEQDALKMLNEQIIFAK